MTWRTPIYGLLIATAALTASAMGTAVWSHSLWSSVAYAHDRQHPELDDWYGNLRRPHAGPSASNSCCSKTDCHTTDAELRNGEWWARLGRRRTDGNWDLIDWVKVPAEAVLERHDNPTGEGVICHSADWLDGRVNPAGITIWCFVPPTES